MRVKTPDLIVIGGGLAGSEAAWQAAQRGLFVHLYEMRPGVSTGAHTTANLAELVCSNSLGADHVDRAPGLLKQEMRRLGSFLLSCAEETAVPAGGALAVDRDAFARKVTAAIEQNRNIKVIHQEMRTIPASPAIIASGPLTSPALSEDITRLTGKDHLYFFDAIAPIVHANSINLNIAYQASRYVRDETSNGDYINCPMTKDEYDIFVDALLIAERIKLRSFEQELEQGIKAGMHHFFEGCLPIEILAQRGKAALAYGPMRPIGLKDPRTGKGAYAVVQLRQDNLARSLYNLVGFQTNLAFSEQCRVFRMIPGLENAEFERYGQMHRNTFIYSPAVLRSTLQHREIADLFFAGQIIGVEGYAGNILSGLLAGWNAARLLNNQSLISLPGETMSGALINYIVNAQPIDFQPMKANYGLLPPIDAENFYRLGRRERGMAYSKRALTILEDFLADIESPS